MLSESLDQALGSLLRDSTSREWLQHEKSGVGQRFKSMLAKVAVVLQVADAAVGLPVGVSELLALENIGTVVAPGEVLDGGLV